MSSRIARMTGASRDAEKTTLRMERELTNALTEGIRAVSVRVDAAGAVFLSNLNPFDEGAS